MAKKENPPQQALRRFCITISQPMLSAFVVEAIDEEAAQARACALYIGDDDPNPSAHWERAGVDYGPFAVTECSEALPDEPKAANAGLFTREQREQLLKNGRANAGRERRQDFRPVVKLYCPWNLAIWLLTEIDPDDYGSAYGLYDLGEGFAELGTVNLVELENRRGPDGLRIERDTAFTATMTLSAYARAARARERKR